MKKLGVYVSVFSLMMLFLGGCVSGPGTVAKEDSTKASWQIELRGAVEETVSADEFEEAKSHSSHYREISQEEKDEVVVYKGMPLWYFLAMIDGRKEEHPYDLDDQRWKAGYEVTLSSADGYASTFNTADLGPEVLFVADSKNGEPILPTVVGNASKSLRVKDLVSIEAFVEAPAADTGRDAFRLAIEVNGQTYSFSLTELEEYPYYVEAPGSYTTSAGTTYNYTYGGVKLKEILAQYIKLKNDSSITFVAMDGYEMSYSGKEVIEPGEGEWILAFKRNGEYLARDPGYIRTVKVGEGTPNILGHKSVKMVEAIRVEGEGFKPFELEMKGKMDFTLERHTLQSGVSCHERTVSFVWKDDRSEYTGIPFYLLLAYSDDPSYAPHKQKDKSILAYDADAAVEGYTVKISASDGYAIELDSRQLHENDDVILAMYKNGEILPDREWPLILVWDEKAETVPDGIKPVRNISSIELIF